MSIKFVVENTGFDFVYQDMLSQFPASELKRKENYERFLSSGQYVLAKAYDGSTFVGYSMFYHDVEHKVFWLDYLAIFKEFHSKGYGGAILKSIKEQFKDVKGCYLEVEKPNAGEPDTLRRIAFYERLGAVRLQVDYYYPNEEGDLPMDLFYLPLSESALPKEGKILNVIKSTFDFMHHDLPHCNEVLAKIKQLGV